MELFLIVKVTWPLLCLKLKLWLSYNLECEPFLLHLNGQYGDHRMNPVFTNQLV